MIKVQTDKSTQYNVESKLIKVISFDDVATLANRERITNYVNERLCSVTISIIIDGMDYLITLPLYIKTYTESVCHMYNKEEIESSLPDLLSVTVNGYLIMKESVFFTSKPNSIKTLFPTLPMNSNDVVNESASATVNAVNTVADSVTSALDNLESQLLRLEEAIANINIPEVDLSKLSHYDITWESHGPYVKYPSLNVTWDGNPEPGSQQLPIVIKRVGSGTAGRYPFIDLYGMNAEWQLVDIGQYTLYNGASQYSVRNQRIYAAPTAANSSTDEAAGIAVFHRGTPGFIVGTGYQDTLYPIGNIRHKPIIVSHPGGPSSEPLYISFKVDKAGNIGDVYAVTSTNRAPKVEQIEGGNGTRLHIYTDVPDANNYHIGMEIDTTVLARSGSGSNSALDVDVITEPSGEPIPGAVRMRESH